MSHLKTFTKGVILGGIVGVIYGLFSAPKKGDTLKKETGKKLKGLFKKGKKIQKDIEPDIKKAAREAKKVEKTVIKKGKNLIGKAKKIVKKIKK